MVQVENAVIARTRVKDPLRKHHTEEVFEILVDPELAFDLRAGKSVD